MFFKGTSTDKAVRVGVGALVVKPGPAGELLVLVGERKGSHGAGMYALPGGHLEYGESFADCAIREVLEETGIQLGQQPKFVHATNNMVEERHYVTIFVRADVPQETEAALLEPNKCAGWSWVPIHQIPQPHFPPLASLLESDYKL